MISTTHNPDIARSFTALRASDGGQYRDGVPTQT